MKSSMNEKSERFLRERKDYKRWLTMFACLAVLVTLGTLAALKYTGTAMTHTKEILDCQYQVHTHTQECYDADHNLICGYADFVIHKHNDNCRDTDGTLVCKLPEVELHKAHDASCYAEQSILVCTKPEHTHGDGCYDADNNLICGEEEHTHGAECYQTQQVLTCTKLAQDLHTHTDACYDKDGNRICGLLQLEEHVHGADCIKTVELSDEEVAKLNETTAEKIIDVEKTTAADDNTNNEETTAADGESAADENGGETTAAGNGETAAAEETTAAEAAAELTQSAETENYIVTVTYTSEAQIPENAVLQVIEYAKDSERFKERTEELGYEPEWLLNVGFFVDGEEVEPAAPVNVKVTMKGQSEVSNYDIVHFGEDGQEALDGVGAAEENGVSAQFTLGSFSDIAGRSSSYDSSTKTLTMTVGDTYDLTGTQGYSNSSSNHSWKSSNSTVATVSGSGKKATIKGVAAGTATITHEYYENRNSWWAKTETFTVTVNPAGSQKYTVEFYNGSTKISDYTLTNLESYQDDDGSWLVDVNLSKKSATSTTDGAVFYGWAKKNGANLERSEAVYIGDATKVTYGDDERILFNYHGSTVSFKTTDFDANRTLKLYATYAISSDKATSSNVGDTGVEFFIRYDGVAPYEPSTYSTSLYTSGITVSDALYYYQHIYNDSASVAANLKNEPTAAQISGVWNQTLKDKYGTWDASKYYIEWYVLKKENTWHVDGVVRERNQWTLTYNANTIDTVNNIIGGMQYLYNSNDTTVHNTVVNGTQTDIEPVRTGYNFNGWNTSADGSGTAFTADDKITVDETTKHILKNGEDTGVTAPVNSSGGDQVTLYAQWTKRKGDITTEKEVSKQKYIKYNPEEDNYDLTLNITGAYGTEMNKNEVEIVLLIDDSNSMYPSLMPKVRDAINNYLVAEINQELNKEKPTIDVRWKILKFDSSASNVTSSWIETKNVAGYVNRINSGSGREDGGTNYQAGFNLAQTALSNKYSGFKNPTKILIWFTDGVPTFHGNNTSGGGHYCNRQDYAGAISGAQGLSCDQFFAIGYGLSDSTKCGANTYGDWNYHTNVDSTGNAISGRQIFNNVADTVPAAKSEKKDISSADQLGTVFSNIAGEINNLKCTDVVIEDWLSNEVQLLGNPALTITATYNKTDNKGATQTITAVPNSDGTIPNTVTLQFKSNPNDTSETATPITATIDPATKKVTLRFAEGYELDPNYTFAVTVKIEASAEAYREYAESNYPNTGAAGTDAPGNATSSGKQGFNSNNEAKVTYTYNEVTKPENYPHPVIQVYPGKLVITKSFSGLSDEVLAQLQNSMTFTLTINGTEYEIPFAGNFVKDEESGLWVSRDKVDYTDKATNTVHSLDLTKFAPGTTYTIVENNAELSGYELTPTETVSSAKRNAEVVIYTEKDNNKKIGKNEIETYAFTNAYEPLKQTIRIEKYEKNGETLTPLAEMKFTLTGTKIDGTVYTAVYGTDENGIPKDGYISDANGLVIGALELPYGSYVLHEEEKGNYYKLDDITFNVGANGIELTGNSAGSTQCEVTGNGNLVLKIYNRKAEIDAQLLKVADGTSIALKGATFTLTDKDGTEILSGTTGDDGILSLGKLDAGVEYILKEVTAPNGYLAMKDDITITVSKDGEEIKVDVKTANPNAGVVTSQVITDDDGNKIIQIQVSNSSGTELPMTGGSGTRWYTFGGIAIIAIGLVYGFGMRRMRRRRLR